MVLDLISQTLSPALDRADIADLELTEANRRIEIEPFGSGRNHMLRALHLRIGITNAVLL